MSYYRKSRSNWSGTNGHGEKIYNPDAYYAAVREDRYGFNSDYTLDQYGNYYDSEY